MLRFRVWFLSEIENGEVESVPGQANPLAGAYRLLAGLHHDDLAPVLEAYDDLLACAELAHALYDAEGGNLEPAGLAEVVLLRRVRAREGRQRREEKRGDGQCKSHDRHAARSPYPAYFRPVTAR